jgi:hypothetical protein
MKNAGSTPNKRDMESFLKDYRIIIKSIEKSPYPNDKFSYTAVQNYHYRLQELFLEAQKMPSPVYFQGLKLKFNNDLQSNSELNERFKECANGLRVKHNFAPKLMSEMENKTLAIIEIAKDSLTPDLAAKGQWKPYIHKEFQGKGVIKTTPAIKFEGYSNEIFPSNKQLRDMNKQFKEIDLRIIKTNPLVDSKGHLDKEGIDVIIPLSEYPVLENFKDLGYKIGEKKLNPEKKDKYELSPPPPTLSDKLKKDNGKGKGRHF